MSSHDRRSYLRAFTTAALPAVAGCLADDDGARSTEPALRETGNVDDRIFVEVANATDAAVTAEVVVNGDSRLASETVDVPAGEHRYVLSRIDETGRYSFDVFVEDGPSGVASFWFGVYEFNTGSNVLASIRDEGVDIAIEE